MWSRERESLRCNLLQSYLFVQKRSARGAWLGFEPLASYLFCSRHGTKPGDCAKYKLPCDSKIFNIIVLYIYMCTSYDIRMPCCLRLTAVPKLWSSAFLRSTSQMISTNFMYIGQVGLEVQTSAQNLRTAEISLNYAKFGVDNSNKSVWNTF